MKVTVYQCEYCKELIRDKEKFKLHKDKHKAIKAINAMYPQVEDEYCDHANGRYSIKRSKRFYEGYKKLVLQCVKDFENKSYPPLSYGWFRSLDDGDSMFYGVACRILNFCGTCYREWGQQYHSGKCKHVDRRKK